MLSKDKNWRGLEADDKTEFPDLLRKRVPHPDGTVHNRIVGIPGAVRH